MNLLCEDLVKDAVHSVDTHDLLADAKLSYNKLGDPSRTNAFLLLLHIASLLAGCVFHLKTAVSCGVRLPTILFFMKRSAHLIFKSLFELMSFSFKSLHIAENAHRQTETADVEKQ